MKSKSQMKRENVTAGRPMQGDAVNHPAHYNQGNIEVIEFIEDQNLEYHEGNAVKYVCRASHKGARIQDLKKAIWYLNRRVELLVAEAAGREPRRPNDTPIAGNA